MIKSCKFTYDELLRIITTCNFAVLAGKHYYPYRAYEDSESESHESATGSGENEDDEAIDDESDGVDADGKADDDDIVIDDGGHWVSNAACSTQ